MVCTIKGVRNLHFLPVMTRKEIPCTRAEPQKMSGNKFIIVISYIPIYKGVMFSICTRIEREGYNKVRFLYGYIVSAIKASLLYSEQNGGNNEIDFLQLHVSRSCLYSNHIRSQKRGRPSSYANTWSEIL